MEIKQVKIFRESLIKDGFPVNEIDEFLKVLWGWGLIKKYRKIIFDFKDISNGRINCIKR